MAKRVSLAPLDPELALAALLRVPPPPKEKPAKRARRPSQARKKRQPKK